MKHKRKLPSITSRTLPSGQVRWQVYCGRDNKGKQRFRLFETQDEAEVHLKKISTAKLNEGAAFWQLTDDQRREALDCYRILDGRSTLREAVQHYADKVLKFRHDKTVREASLLLVEKLTERGLADISLRDITLTVSEGSPPFTATASWRRSPVRISMSLFGTTTASPPVQK